MKFRKMMAITLSVITVLGLVACGTKKENEQAEEVPSTEGPIGIYITYGEEGHEYAFVNPETDQVFLAELPLDQIKDEDGNSLSLEDLHDGDCLQLTGSGIMTASIPPIYAGITEAVRLEEGTKEIEATYRPMVEEMLVETVDPSKTPDCSIEMTQSYGTVSTAIYETENEPLKMEEATEEVILKFSSIPSDVKLFVQGENAMEEVELTKSDSGFTAILETDKSYEIQGTWESQGTITYQFETTSI